jgi:hypothetical protein
MMGTAEHQSAPLVGASVGQGVYVEDIDAHFERAQAAGARVVYPPEDTEWGTRRYRVLDPEGYEWSFGNYQPGTAGDSWVPRRPSPSMQLLRTPYLRTSQNSPSTTFMNRGKREGPERADSSSIASKVHSPLLPSLVAQLPR